MPTGFDFTRELRPGEEHAIDQLLRAAFGRSDEAELVRRLRADRDIWIELVKPWEGVIAGYAALSHMREPKGWACLAPVAVDPKFQRGALAPEPALRARFAVGSLLVAEIVEMVLSPPPRQASGRPLPGTVVVLGEPSFYERAGFSASRARNLVSPYGTTHTSIARPGDDSPAETLLYPPAFAA